MYIGIVVEVKPETDDSWSLHYLFTGALRDTAMARSGSGKSLLHVFGGDYASGSGRKGIPKVDRIRGYVHDLISPKAATAAEYHTGPLLVRSGLKVSKSLGNSRGARFSYEQILDFAANGAPVIDLDEF